jgi:hypothetical protein
MTQWRRHFPALALLVFALALAAGVVSVAGLWLVNRHNEMTGAEGRLEALRTAARVGVGGQVGGGAGLLLAGETTGRAAADLQLKVGAVAREHGAIVRSMQILNPKREGELTEIVLEVNLQAGTVALRNLLHFLETSAPLLIVDELSVRHAVEGPQGAAKGPVQLAVGMKIRGFAAARETP